MISLIVWSHFKFVAQPTCVVFAFELASAPFYTLSPFNPFWRDRATESKAQPTTCNNWNSILSLFSPPFAYAICLKFLTRMIFKIKFRSDRLCNQLFCAFKCELITKEMFTAERGISFRACLYVHGCHGPYITSSFYEKCKICWFPNHLPNMYIDRQIASAIQTARTRCAL